jgi:hypothetical protein
MTVSKTVVAAKPYSIGFKPDLYLILDSGAEVFQTAAGQNVLAHQI